MSNLSKTARTLLLAAVAGSAIVTTTGCAVVRGQQSAGSYVDDAAITTAVKAKLTEAKFIDIWVVGVETLKGEVQLSGFSKSADDRRRAEEIARNVNGVRAVRNNLIVR